MADQEPDGAATGFAVIRIVRVLLVAFAVPIPVSLLGLLVVFLLGSSEATKEALISTALCSMLGFVGFGFAGILLQHHLVKRMPLRVGVIVSYEPDEESDGDVRIGIDCETANGEARHVVTRLSVSSAWQHALVEEGRRLAFRCFPDDSLVEVDWRETRRRFGKAAAPTAIVCPRCGAPLKTTAGSGPVQCDYCDAEVRL